MTSFCKDPKSSVIGETSCQLAIFPSDILLTKLYKTGIGLNSKSAQIPGSTVMTELAGQLAQMINSVRKHELECQTKSTHLFNSNECQVWSERQKVEIKVFVQWSCLKDTKWDLQLADMVSLVLINQQNSGEWKNNTRILKITSQRPKTKGSKKNLWSKCLCDCIKNNFNNHTIKH